MLYETIEYNYTDDDDEDDEYNRLLKIQKKIECEISNEHIKDKPYYKAKAPKKKSRFDDIV